MAEGDAAMTAREAPVAGRAAQAATTEAPCPSHCPIRDLISRLGDKWSVLVLIALAKTETKCLRFSQLMRSVDGISQRMLSTTLRYLERDGIVTRHLYPEVPPRVEYTLTERGLGLLEPVRALFIWIDHEWPAIEQSRREYDARNEERVAHSGNEASSQGGRVARSGNEASSRGGRVAPAGNEAAGRDGRVARGNALPSSVPIS
jgi:DNA-binding HxlR family transcriptional regulator